MTDREKFEAWAKTKNCDLEKFSRGEKKGQYKNPVVEKMCEAYLAALASQQPADDGWVDWVGCECPVSINDRVYVRFRDGEISEDAEIAGLLRWTHVSADWDIIAYRVVKP